MSEDMPQMSVRFKNFEIRECIGWNAKHAKYELVRWSNEKLTSTGKRYCWVVAFIRWNEKEPCWQFDCVGMRFIIPAKPDVLPYVWQGSHFCPNCGADMRGVDHA